MKKRSAHSKPARRESALTTSFGALLGLKPRVSHSELTAFARQFSTLLKAGVPIVRALDTMLNMTRPGGLRTALEQVKDDVESGDTLSDAMSRCPGVFDELFVSMVRASEAGGFLSRILRRLSDFMAKTERLKNRVFGALAYPAAVTGTATLIVLGIMMFVLPQFIKIFQEEQIPLPWMTQALIAISETLIGFWYLLPLIPVITLAAVVCIRSTDRGRYATDMLLLYLPIFGDIARKSTISRVCRTLAELDSAGVPLLQSLSILQTVINKFD